MNRKNSKKHVDTIIKNGRILTMNDKFSEIVDGSIAFSEGKIVAIECTETLSEKFTADTTINASDDIVMPGFVNGHCHAAMSLFRGYAENVSLNDFLQCVWEVEKRYLTPETVETGSYLSCIEMALSGVTTFVDMYWYPKATIKAAREIGLNIVSGPVFVNIPGADDIMDWKNRIGFARRFCDEFSDLSGVFLSLAPHSCYALGEAQLECLAELSVEYNLPIQIHAAEALSEMEIIRNTFGMTPIALMKKTGILRDGCMIAHGVHLTDDDISMIKDNNASVIHCPLSNGKTAAGIARIKELCTRGVSVGLGTDGPSTANDLDLWKAMRYCAMMQSIKYNDPTSLKDRDIVSMATSGGAKAVGLFDHTGSLEVGKQADLMIVSTDGIHMKPMYNPYASIVYAAGRDDVRDVFVRGRHIVSNYKIMDTGLPSKTEQFDEVTGMIALKGRMHDLQKH